MKHCLAVLSLLFLLESASAQNSPTVEAGSLPQKLESARYGLLVDNGVLSGSGASVLAEAIRQSPYILIGEDHLTREVPQFTTALCDLTAKQGLVGMALEVSPEAAEFMMHTLKAPDRWDRMVALTRTYPSSIAFLDSRQEGDLVANCAQASHNSNFHLWGLDQNFVGSAGWLIDLMLAAHHGSGSKEALLRLKADEQRDAAEAKASGNPATLFMLSEKTDAELKEAAPEIDRDGGPEVKKIFQELVSSHSIYEKEVHSGDANVERARLLKQNFRDAMNQLSPAEKDGKVIVKFGDWHMYRGFNPLHHRDLGNYIAEEADVNGRDSLHICILGAGGMRRVFGGYGKPFQVQASTPAQDRWYRWMEAFMAKQIPGQWTLFDLRALRFERFGQLDPDVERMIEGYDFLVVVPEVTPAEMTD